jgi:hypothetical protein
MANTIFVKHYNEPIMEEKVAAGTITPGMLIELTTADKVQAHSTVEGDAEVWFATEDEYQGNDIDDNYVADDKVQTWFPQRGEWVYALLADGENVSIGDRLTSNGDGYLRKYASSSGTWEYPDAVVAVAVEALDLSNSSGAEPTQRIKVRAI